MQFYFILFLLVWSFPADAQSIQYAKGVVPLKDKENVLIAGKYNNTIQVLKEDIWGAIDVYLYSSDLVLKEKKNLQTEKEGYAQIEIIPYSNFYYAFLRYNGKNAYRLLKITASGAFEDQTSKVKGLLFRNDAPGIVLKVQNRMLFVTSYFDSVKSKALFNVYSTDSMLAVKKEQLIALDYKRREETMEHLVFPDTASAYVVKSFGRSSKRLGELDIIKFDLARNTENTLTLSSNEDIYFHVNFKYNSSDSTFLLLTRVKARAPINKDSIERYYCARMNNDLEELMPSVLVQVKWSQSERVLILIDDYAPFVYENNASVENTQSSIYQDYDFRFYRGATPTIESGPFKDLFELQYIDAVTRRLMLPYQQNDDLYRSDVNMRLISLDKAGRKNYVLLKSKDGKFRAEFFNCFFSKNSDKAYIFYSNRYSLSRGGINYIAAQKGVFGKEEFLPVNQHYEYLLPLSKKVEEEFIIPYKHKGKLGLVKIGF